MVKPNTLCAQRESSPSLLREDARPLAHLALAYPSAIQTPVPIPLPVIILPMPTRTYLSLSLSLSLSCSLPATHHGHAPPGYSSSPPATH
jgi:hypothetical protein